MSFVAAPGSRHRVLRRMTLPNGRCRCAENSSHPRRVELLVLGFRSNLDHGENTAVEFGEKAARQHERSLSAAEPVTLREK